jgi:hypothetical protein
MLLPQDLPPERQCLPQQGLRFSEITLVAPGRTEVVQGGEHMRVGLAQHRPPDRQGPLELIRGTREVSPAVE